MIIYFHTQLYKKYLRAAQFLNFGEHRGGLLDMHTGYAEEFPKMIGQQIQSEVEDLTIAFPTGHF